MLGTNITNEMGLLDVPTALSIFYVEEKGYSVPLIAVACGSNIFVYKFPPIHTNFLEI